MIPYPTLCIAAAAGIIGLLGAAHLYLTLAGRLALKLYGAGVAALLAAR